MTLGQNTFTFSDSNAYSTTSGSYVTKNTITVNLSGVYYLASMALSMEMKTSGDGKTNGRVVLRLQNSTTGADHPTTHTVELTSDFNSSYQTFVGANDSIGEHAYSYDQMKIDIQVKHSQTDGDTSYINNTAGSIHARRMV